MLEICIQLSNSNSCTKPDVLVPRPKSLHKNEGFTPKEITHETKISKPALT